MYVYALLLFMMSFVRVFDNAFWGDEGFSIALAKMSVSDMMIATAKDVHPPLYYLLMLAAGDNRQPKAATNRHYKTA